MKNIDQYEDLRFTNKVNIIRKEYCPEQFPKHWHKSVELVAILQNVPAGTQAVVNLNQVMYVMNPGDLLFIWPGELHEIVENSDRQLMALQFPITVISEVNDLALYMNQFRRYHMLSEKEEPELVQKLFSCMAQMISLMEENQEFAGVKILIHLYQMFIILGTYLTEHKKTGIDPQTEENKRREKIQDSCTYIQENCECDLTLDKVSGLYGFSSCYFSRCFKKVTTYNFIEYLSIQRVKRVQMLLTNTALSITEAAYQAGFNSLSTFNRVFHNYAGCSPSEYKKYYSGD